MAGDNTGRRKGLANLRPPWKKGDPSPNPGGRPKSGPDFRARCREVAGKLLDRIEKADFLVTSGPEGGAHVDLRTMVTALEVLADRGGYLPADRQIASLLKALESPALTAEDRKRVLDELVGPSPAPALESQPEPSGVTQAGDPEPDSV